MLQKSTLSFLTDLSQHNDRDWFQKNKPRYLAAKEDFENLLQQLINGIAEFDREIADVDAKKSVFRIYRDVRFGNDKRPYKENMGAWISKGGRKSPFAGYYIHIQTNGPCFLAGGKYAPESSILKAIRQEIDYNTDEFKALLSDKTFKKYFGKLTGAQLKTAPRDYPKDHPEIELLKFKSYTVSHEFDHEQLLTDKFVPHAVEVYKGLKPLNDFLNRVIE